jgi:23S rRNA pseudouridine955/2504/2580 synthase
MSSIYIHQDAANQRLDRYCRKYFKPYEHISLKDIYHWIRKGLIRVQVPWATKATKVEEGTTILQGDQVVFHDSISQLLVWKKEVKSNTHTIEHWMQKQWWTWDSLILYEDDDWLIWNKPAGIVAHEGNKHTEDITMNQLLECYHIAMLPSYHIAKKSNRAREEKNNHNTTEEWKATPSKQGNSETFKPSFAYRLDKDTTGVLVSAKTYPALQHINQLIRDHDINKLYLARVVGKVDPAALSKNANLELKKTGELVIGLPLFKWFNASSWRAQTFINHEKGLESKTLLKLLKVIDHPKLGPLSLVQCQLLSGRMHQIRAHLGYLGYPVLGDIQYGNAVSNRLAHKFLHINRQLLHSYQYQFIDHNNKTIKTTAPLPDEFDLVDKT